MTNDAKITFSFGKNWKGYLHTVDQTDIDKARQDIAHWLGEDHISGKTVVDIGSGSGIHSLAFYSLGASSIRSFDYDQHSVEATQTLWDKEGQPQNWTVTQGSILDREFVDSLGEGFDIVYSWGVLHHTGDMWPAIDNAISLVKPGGRLWIALYSKGPLYPQHLALKEKYNAASSFGQKWMVGRAVGRVMLGRIKRFQNPFAWNEKRGRGMNVYHDIVDWLGGLPYEVASEDEVVTLGRRNGLVLERIWAMPEGGCSTYVFSSPTADP